MLEKSSRLSKVGRNLEAFEKCWILVKVNEDEDFNRRNTMQYFED